MGKPIAPTDPRAPVAEPIFGIAALRHASDADLKVFQPTIDKSYIGPRLELQVVLCNLNDNVTFQTLMEWAEPFGDVEDAVIPTYNGMHLGIGHILFRYQSSARACAEKLHLTQRFGEYIHCFLDANGDFRAKMVEEAMEAIREGHTPYWPKIVKRLQAANILPMTAVGVKSAAAVPGYNPLSKSSILLPLTQGSTASSGSSVVVVRGELSDPRNKRRPGGSPAIGAESAPAPAPAPASSQLSSSAPSQSTTSTLSQPQSLELVASMIANAIKSSGTALSQETRQNLSQFAAPSSDSAAWDDSGATPASTAPATSSVPASVPANSASTGDPWDSFSASSKPSGTLFVYCELHTRTLLIFHQCTVLNVHVSCVCVISPERVSLLLNCVILYL